MATATNETRTAKAAARSRDRAPKPPSLDFLVYDDNAGDYHWEIVAGGGDSLAQSVSFASRDDAERTARYVYDSVRAPRFEPNAAQARHTVNA